jgi:hypothetical protein
MIMQKHPVVFADLLNRAKPNALKIERDSTGYKHDDPGLPAMFQQIEGGRFNKGKFMYV